MTRVILLGTAAGGGFPQWNCACDNCVRARSGQLAARTQDSVAIARADGRFLLVQASPDIHRQIAQTPALHPRAPRDTPIAAIVLTNGDLDHVLGLFSLRESQPLLVFATDAVREGLLANPMMRTLQRFPEQLSWQRLALDAETSAGGGLSIRAVAVPGKLPVHLVGTSKPSPEDNVALIVRDGEGRTVVYASSCLDPAPLAAFVDGADLLLFDGTFWTSDELPHLGLGAASAEEMAHLPLSGERGTLARLRGVRAKRKVFVHVNNSNPILDPESDAAKRVRAAGWSIGVDGEEIALGA